MRSNRFHSTMGPAAPGCQVHTAAAAAAFGCPLINGRERFGPPPPLRKMGKKIAEFPANFSGDQGGRLPFGRLREEEFQIFGFQIYSKNRRRRSKGVCDCSPKNTYRPDSRSKKSSRLVQIRTVQAVPAFRFHSTTRSDQSPAAPGCQVHI